MKAVVSGMIVSFPVGGVAWDYGQYALGLERLGFEVYYLEDNGRWTYDPSTQGYEDSPAYGIDFLERSLALLSPGLAGRWHFRDHAGRSHGLDAGAIADVMAEADLFLDISGDTILRPEYLACRRKVLVDTDPGWNHFVVWPRWEKTSAGYGIHDHDYFFTYAERIGRSGCNLPTFGIEWHPTRPPVVTSCWSPSGPGTTWTTMLSWNNYLKPIEHEGRSYGSKDVEFPKIEDLPSLVDVRLEVAAGGTEPPVERWRNLGWGTKDSGAESETMESYRSYVSGSRGEFSVAKNVYVSTGSGWFSCRSACYLAASRPVVLQDTGFSELLPTGKGLLTFSNRAEAVDALRTVENDYESHQDAARELSEQFLSSDTVLGELLDRVGVG